MHFVSVASLGTVQLVPYCSNHFICMSSQLNGSTSLFCVVPIAADVFEVTIIGALGRVLLDGRRWMNCTHVHCVCVCVCCWSQGSAMPRNLTCMQLAQPHIYVRTRRCMSTCPVALPGCR